MLRMREETVLKGARIAISNGAFGNTISHESQHGQHPLEMLLLLIWTMEKDWHGFEWKIHVIVRSNER